MTSLTAEWSKKNPKQQHEALCSHHFIDVNWSKSAFLSSPSSYSLVSLRTTCSHCTGLTPLSLDTLGYLRQRWCRIVSVISDCVTSYFLKLAFSLSVISFFSLSVEEICDFFNELTLSHVRFVKASLSFVQFVFKCWLKTKFTWFSFLFTPLLHALTSRQHDIHSLWWRWSRLVGLTHLMAPSFGPCSYGSAQMMVLFYSFPKYVYYVTSRLLHIQSKQLHPNIKCI